MCYSTFKITAVLRSLIQIKLNKVYYLQQYLTKASVYNEPILVSGRDKMTHATIGMESN